MYNMNKQKLSVYGECHKCKETWYNGDIPIKDRKHYSPPYKYSKLLRVKSWNKKDFYRCPTCNKRYEMEEIEYV